MCISITGGFPTAQPATIGIGMTKGSFGFFMGGFGIGMSFGDLLFRRECASSVTSVFMSVCLKSKYSTIV